jgi:hypothetical protein
MSKLLIKSEGLNKRIFIDDKEIDNIVGADLHLEVHKSVLTLKILVKNIEIETEVDDVIFEKEKI